MRKYLFSLKLQLKSLFLHDNDLDSFSASMFNGLSGVTTLSLKDNQVADLPDRVFAAMPLLANLDLSSNQISSIEPRAFEGLSELKSLNLSNNPIEEPLPEPVCEFIRSVEEVQADGIDMEVVCPSSAGASLADQAWVTDGDAAVTAIAKDADGNAVMQRFPVVGEPAVRPIPTQALAPSVDASWSWRTTLSSPMRFPSGWSQAMAKWSVPA